jgi:hypothetical protein
VGRLTTSIGQVEALVGILTFSRHGHEAQPYYALPAEWATQLAAAAQSGLDDAQARPVRAVPADTHPWFLQAAGLEIDGEWCKMRTVAARWVAAEPVNTEALRALKLARGRNAAYRWRVGSNPSKQLRTDLLETGSMTSCCPTLAAWYTPTRSLSARLRDPQSGVDLRCVVVAWMEVGNPITI